MSEGLALAGISHAYGDRAVLHDVSLTVERGRVRALVGENGAGKSTLIRVACGLVAQESGTVAVDGARIRSGDALSAIAHGIGVMHQHFMLVEPLTVAENVVLGAETRRWGVLLDRGAARVRVRELAGKYGLEIDPDAHIETLTLGERQRVELLKVLHRGARMLLLDEPTAVLSPNEVTRLLDVIRGLARGGAGVLFVSHKLDEVLAVADDVTVLRRGRVVLAEPRSEVDADRLARAVVGGELPAAVGARGEYAANGAFVLAVEGLKARGVGPISLRVRRGEILGIAGVEGNGQRDLAQAIAGIAPMEGGTLRIADRDIAGASVGARRSAGLGYVPEDRERSGLMGDLTIAENLLLGDPSVATSRARRMPKEMRATAMKWIERFGIEPNDPNARAGELSGGNAQKVLVARELARPLAALVVAQPTRGVDLGAAAEIHAALRAARDEGLAVLLIASDLDEIRGLSDRVVVMRRGAIVGEMPVADATDGRLGPLMVGASTAAYRDAGVE